MEYYGNNDWRNYLQRQNTLAHFGIPRRSGRYAWGSGEDPYHHGADVPGGRKVKKRSMNDAAIDILKKKIDNGTATKYERWTYDRAMKKRSGRDFDGYTTVIDLYDSSKGQKPKSKEQISRDLDSDRMKTLEKMNNGTASDEEIRKLVKGDLKSGYVKPDSIDRQAMRVDQARGKLQGYSKALYDETSDQSAKPKNETVQKIESAIKKADSYTNSDNLKENASKAMKKVDEVTRPDEIKNNLKKAGNFVDNKLDGASKQLNESLGTRRMSKKNQAIVNQKLQDAKNNDRYDLSFIEAIQNKVILKDGHESERLKAYREYLEDPEDFWRNKVNKYKDE